MNSESFTDHMTQQLNAIRRAGTYKNERFIGSRQDSIIRLADGR